MKKTYISPEFLQEVFSTEDVITVSTNALGVDTTPTEGQKGITEVLYDSEPHQRLWGDDV